MVFFGDTRLYASPRGFMVNGVIYTFEEAEAKFGVLTGIKCAFRGVFL